MDNIYKQRQMKWFVISIIVILILAGAYVWFNRAGADPLRVAKHQPMPNFISPINNSTVGGTVPFEIQVTPPSSGARIGKLSLYVEYTLIKTVYGGGNNGLYNIDWDSTKTTPGEHLISAVGIATTGARGINRIRVTVDQSVAGIAPAITNGPSGTDDTNWLRQQPIVDIISPLLGDTVGGTIDVQISATPGNAGNPISYVVLYDGYSLIGKTSNGNNGVYTISWDTTKFPVDPNFNSPQYPNAHLLQAGAIASDNKRMVDGIWVFVDQNTDGGAIDTTKPNIQITAPAKTTKTNPLIVTKGAKVDISANLTDNVGFGLAYLLQDIYQGPVFTLRKAGSSTLGKVSYNGETNPTYTYQADTSGLATGDYGYRLVVLDASQNVKTATVFVRVQ